MATIVTRAGKGSPLTNTEVDSNFTNLNAEVTPLRHSIRPSLLLDFANSKTLDPRITFSRSSTGTYYDGKTHAKAEENLVQYSQEFDNSAWTKSSAIVTANATTAPDGTTTADELIENASSALHRIFKLNFTVDTSKTYTQSVFVKANTRDGILMRTGSGGIDADSVKFDLGTQTTTNVGVGADSSSITDVGNGWYRCSMTFSPSTNSFVVYIGLLDSNGDATYTGDGSSLYLWGAQLEQRDSVTAYTPTTTQPITNYIPVLQTAAAGTARFDHDPVTGESKGLLIEEQRTNLIPYSDDFSNAYWSHLFSSVDNNSVVSPDGSLNAATVTSTSSGTGIGVRRDLVSYTAGNFYTASFYVKYVNAQYVAIDLPDAATSNNDNAAFDILNGTVIKDGNTSNGGYAAITDVGNGWYRISITGYAQATLATGFVALYLNNSSNSYAPFFPNVGKSFKVWGAQLEAGAFPTSYIPTSGSQVTRSADAASMTGTNFSDWYRQDEGTVYGEYNTKNEDSIYRRVCELGKSNNFVFSMQIQDGYYRLYGKDISGSNTQIGAYNFTEGNDVKIIANYNKYNVENVADGSQITTSSSIQYGTATAFGIGASTIPSGFLCGTIKKLAYYPTALTSAELQALTEA